MPTTRLYWEDAYQSEFTASVLAAAEDWWALSATAFYPGGGGQPPDTGVLVTEGREAVVTGVRSEGGLVWHRTTLRLATGQDVRGRVDWPRRYQLMKYHTLLHIVNTVMLDRHGPSSRGRTSVKRRRASTSTWRPRCARRGVRSKPRSTR
jgi:Ser-tRNA(Ala) deacylase AlaX